MMCSLNGKMCWVHKLAVVLVFVGAINWGLVGAFKFNLVEAILGPWPGLVRIIYVLVGISGLLMCVGDKCKMCKAGEMKPS